MSWTPFETFRGEDLQLEGQETNPGDKEWEAVCGAVVASRLVLSGVRGELRVFSLARRCRDTAVMLHAHQLFTETSLLADAISCMNCVAILGNDQRAPLLLKVLDVDCTFPYTIFETSIQRFIPTGASVELMTVAPNAQQIALGLSDGSVVLLTLLNFEKKTSINSNVSVSGWLLSPPQPYSISGLHFCLLPPTGNGLPKVVYKYSFATRVYRMLGEALRYLECDGIIYCSSLEDSSFRAFHRGGL